jgi:hypothetical protein
MSFYTDASLVLIPSGIKDQKVYCAKPVDGSGDLVFSRSNDTATRVASNGLIEKVRTNIALHSEDQTAWTDQNQTFVTANAAANPLNGAVTADKVYPSVILDDHYRGLSMGSVVGEFSSSIYVKADGYSIIDYGVFNSTAANYPVRAVFDLSTETITQIDGSISSITSVGSGWYRISVSASVASTSTMGIYHRVRSTGTSGTFAGDGTSGMLLWGCQLESGVTTSYIGPTTSAAVSVGPVANLPRLDYLGSSCPRLLLEPQRTNLVTYSEQIDNAAWLNAGGTTTANTAVSPSGYQDADTLTGVRYQASFASNTYTLSAFAKKVDGDNTFVLRFDAPTTKVAVFNLNNGTIVSADAGYTPTITNYGNGWYRCTLTTPASTSISNAVLISANAGVSSTYVWGCQLEIGAYATSYIPTLGASVTRGLDAASKTGISSLIGQTEGTLYWEGVRPEGANDTSAVSLSDTTTNNEVTFRFTAVDTVEFYLRSGGSQTVASTYTGADLNQNTKIAFAYKANDVAVYVNGTLVVLDTSATVPVSLTAFKFSRGNDGTPMIASVSQALIFPTRLSNADLAALTA